MIKNFRSRLVLCAFFCNTMVMAQTNCPNTISSNCKWNISKNCWGLPQFNGLCSEYEVGYPYYTSFSDSGDYFNKPITNNCQPWKFSMLQSNCCDNPNFNWNSTCTNDTITPYSWAQYPRMKVSPGGRKGGSDKCMEIFSYPGDYIQTSVNNCRSEACILPETHEGETRYYSWSFRFPNDWIDDDTSFCPDYKFKHYFLMQVHPYHGNAYNCLNQVPVILFNYKYNKTKNSRTINVNYGCACNGSTPTLGTFPVSLKYWYDVVLKVKWTSDPDMSQQTFTMDVFANSTRIRTFKGYGPNLYKDDTDTTKTVLQKIQIGLYRGEKNCTIQHMYFDEFSMAEQRNQLNSIHVNPPYFSEDLWAIQSRTVSDVDNPCLLYFVHQQDQIRLKINEESTSHPLLLRLYDVNGRLAGSYSLQGFSEYSVNRNSLTNGIYFYHLDDAETNQPSIGKVIIY